MKYNHLSILLAATVFIASCTSDDNSRQPQRDVQAYTFEFSATESWQAGFADYPAGAEVFYELLSEFTALPAPLNNRQGLRISGNNHSDDLFMFVKTPITGLKANTLYAVEFDVTLATNAQSGCMGMGGAPGESVAVKAGVSVEEPVAENNGAGNYLMNIDKGNQMTGGSDAIVLGDIANTQACGEVAATHELKQLDNNGETFSVLTGSSGTVWLMLATDSGYESTTDMYWEKAVVTFTEQP